MDQTNQLFWEAAASGDFQKVVAALNQGADVNVRNAEARTALMRTAKRGHEKIVRYLIDHGADVNAKDNNGKTALMGAAKKGHFEIVKMLVDAGADVNVQDIIS